MRPNARERAVDHARDVGAPRQVGLKRLRATPERGDVADDPRRPWLGRVVVHGHVGAARASARAVARPMPTSAPVTSADFFR